MNAGLSESRNGISNIIPGTFSSTVLFFLILGYWFLGSYDVIFLHTKFFIYLSIILQFLFFPSDIIRDPWKNFSVFMF